jgi:pimeloyl-ACP methyl ester carboxylesterase
MAEPERDAPAGSRQASLACLGPAAFHRIAYADWPARQERRVPVVCVHGLTRNGRDFDPLAGRLAAERRVVCPDMAGRGLSERLADWRDYGFPLYLADCASLIARLDVPRVDWVGTSMGGLIGLFLSAKAESPIRRLVLNDVGPFLPKEALAYIGEYVSRTPRFADLAALEAYLRDIYRTFGRLSDGDWARMAASSHWRNGDGSYSLAYDPALAEGFKSEPKDIDLWDEWAKVTCPVLIVRGKQSLLLTEATAQRMMQRPHPTALLEIPDAGHAPALMDEGQIEAVRQWLDQP